MLTVPTAANWTSRSHLEIICELGHSLIDQHEAYQSHEGFPQLDNALKRLINASYATTATADDFWKQQRPGGLSCVLNGNWPTCTNEDMADSERKAQMSSFEHEQKRQTGRVSRMKVGLEQYQAEEDVVGRRLDSMTQRLCDQAAREASGAPRTAWVGYSTEQTVRGGGGKAEMQMSSRAIVRWLGAETRAAIGIGSEAVWAATTIRVRPVPKADEQPK